MMEVFCHSEFLIGQLAALVRNLEAKSLLNMLNTFRVTNFSYFSDNNFRRVLFSTKFQPSEIHLKRNCDSGRIAWHMSNKLSCCDVCHTEYIALTPTHCCNATGKRLAEHNLSLYSSGMLKRKRRVKFMRQTQQHLSLAILVEATKGVRSIRLTINTWARVFGFFFWNTNRWKKNLSRY